MMSIKTAHIQLTLSPLIQQLTIIVYFYMCDIFLIIEAES